MWEFFNSSFGLLIAGFISTGILGGFLNFLIQAKTWERQRRHELLSKSLTDGQELFDEVGNLLSLRTFGLRRVLWMLEEQTSEDRVVEVWEEYYDAVKLWNRKLMPIRFRIEALAGKDIANSFLDYGDDANVQNPKSLHYKTRIAHSAVLLAKDTKPNSELIEAAGITLDHLQNEVEVFQQRLSAALLYSYKTLKQLSEDAL